MVTFHQAVADVDAGRRAERVRHGAADEDLVTKAGQSLDDADLVGHLGPAEHHDERSGGVGDGVSQEIELLLDQEPDDAGLALHDLGDR